jgi:hypothetical protein
MPKARIVGVDLTPPQLDIPGVELHAGDQSDQEFLQSLIARYGGFDIVIDDASHIGRLTIASFTELYPAVRPGGWYVIEDLETSYWESHGGGPVGTRGTAVDLIKGMVDRVQQEPGAGDASELHVFDGIAFIRKPAD